METPSCVVGEEAKCEGLERVMICTDIEKFFQVRVQLPLQEKKELLPFLLENMDIFSWSAYEALGVDPNFICLHLNVNPNVVSKKQLPWHSSKEHAEAVKEEVTKLKRARVIKEVFLPIMVGQYNSSEEEWEMEGVCRFHRSKQSLP